MMQSNPPTALRADDLSFRVEAQDASGSRAPAGGLRAVGWANRPKWRGEVHVSPRHRGRAQSPGRRGPAGRRGSQVQVGQGGGGHAGPDSSAGAVHPRVHGARARAHGRYPHLGRFQIEGAADEQIARDAMQLTETEEFAERTLDTLSGGERQRVFVSRALAQQPRVLLLDEPTANLDVLHKLRVLDLVRRLVDEGLTAVAAIHDLGMAARYCDRLILLSDWPRCSPRGRRKTCWSRTSSSRPSAYGQPSIATRLRDRWPSASSLLLRSNSHRRLRPAPTADTVGGPTSILRRKPSRPGWGTAEI